LNPNTRTYLSDNTVVNLFNVISEAKALSEILKNSVESILTRVYIDKNSSVVTPYHSLINKIRELSNDNKTGSVATGVSEVNKIKEKIGIDIKVNDLLNGESFKKLLNLFDYTSNYVNERKNKIDKKLFDELINEKDLYYLTEIRNREYIIRCYENLINSKLFNIISSIEEFHKNGNVLFEGSQGVLLDKIYGIKPNITSLDTTNNYGVKLAEYINTNINTIGCIGALNSRHGYGILPTFDKKLQKVIHDYNQIPSYFQGVPKYGWFDSVLARYSLKYSKNKELFMSALDRLSSFDKLKICNSYIYTGKIDEEFERTFDYYNENGKVIINDIKQNSDNLRYYLSKCMPLYIELNGFKKDITQVHDYYDLPVECKDYISLIEFLIQGNITLIGVGPDRSQKLERKIR
jgi:adenylosuccinate synthase